ncbi:MAG: 30S ribosome-binding factor RbfA [Crocinitomicaceae bacterium]
MGSFRQKKIESVIQKELSTIFREQARSLCLGAMVTVTAVKMSPDMSFAKGFLSIFGTKDQKEVFQHINSHAKTVRYELGKRLGKNLRRIPELAFVIDDSLDYAEEIDRILKDK